MQSVGRRLRELRESLGLTLRDVEIASRAIAEARGLEEFIIYPSRLTDIETKGIVPGLYRLYILSVLYRTDLTDVLKMYGVDLEASTADRQASQLSTEAALQTVRPLNAEENPGKALRGIREQIGLTLKDVADASTRIANLRGIEEFSINSARLSDFETKRVIPSIYRLYVLSVIYRVEFATLLRVYGIDLSKAQSDFDLLSEAIKQRAPKEYLPPEGIKQGASKEINSDLSITFDPNLSAKQVKATLQALADYYRACGGLGFQIDFEFEQILTREPEYV